MKDITLEMFTAAIKKQPFVTRDCSICGYTMSYFYVGSQLVYDSGCVCTRSSKLNPVDESELEFYLVPEKGWITNVELFISKVNDKCE